MALETHGQHLAAARALESDLDSPSLGDFVAPAPKPFSNVVTRVIDVIGSSFGLIILSPVLLLAAIAVKVTSRGSVFFWQDRCGKNETTFRVVKLRTMVADHAQVIDLVRVEALEKQGVLTKSDNDPRVTAVGKFLRRTSIDELPQLWNVLRGDMSLVGPRPLLPFMLEPYPDLRAARGVVKPGLTGLWQVSARDDNTSAWSMAREDLDYVSARTVSGDLVIMLKTIPAVVRGSGAV